MEDGRPTKRDLAIILILLILAIIACCMEMGCNGNSANIKPNNAMETSLKNQQDMSEKIEKLDGDLVKIQQSISVVMNTVTQTFETLQGSTKTGDVDGDVNTSHDVNSIWYGIGLVAVVLAFALILIWLLAKMLKEVALKFLK